MMDTPPGYPVQKENDMPEPHMMTRSERQRREVDALIASGWSPLRRDRFDRPAVTPVEMVLARRDPEVARRIAALASPPR